MNKKITIITSLNEGVNQFNELISGLDQAAFETNYNNKWSAGQDLVHLIKVLKIVNIGFTLPKPLLYLMYGVNKNETRSFELLQILYKNALEGGAKSPAIYIPNPVLFESKNHLIQKHQQLNEAFIDKMNHHSDHALDRYRLPHPILGKVTLRELASFTSFHTLHHLELLRSKLAHTNP
jgi:hypothetical protein